MFATKTEKTRSLAFGWTHQPGKVEPLRTIYRVATLIDISPVTFPAYTGTSSYLKEIGHERTGRRIGADSAASTAGGVEQGHSRGASTPLRRLSPQGSDLCRC